MTQPINQLEGKIQTLINKYQELKEINTRAMDHNHELETTLADRNQVIQGLENQLRELTQICTSREEKITRLQEENDAMSEKIEQFEATTKDATGRLDSILSQIEEL